MKTRSQTAAGRTRRPPPRPLDWWPTLAKCLHRWAHPLLHHWSAHSQPPGIPWWCPGWERLLFHQRKPTCPWIYPFLTWTMMILLPWLLHALQDKSPFRFHLPSAPGWVRQLFNQGPCTSTPVRPSSPVNKPDSPPNSQRSSPWHSLKGLCFDTPLTPEEASESPANAAPGKDHDDVVTASQVLGDASPCTTPRPASVVPDMGQQVSKLVLRKSAPARSVC